MSLETTNTSDGAADTADTSNTTLVGLAGGPSTGKSTLAERLSERTKGGVAEEQLQGYWEDNHTNRKLADKQLVEVANLQLEAENKTTADVVVSDTTPITAEAYARYYHGTASEELIRLSAQAKQRYDLIVLCGADIPFEEDGVRSGDGTRQEIQNHTVSILEREGIDYVTASGAVEQRVEAVLNKIKSRSVP